jgi:hypothetical protein
MKTPTLQELRRQIRRSSFRIKHLNGDISFREMLEGLAEVEREDGLKTIVNAPISAIALLHGIEEMEGKSK